MVYVSKGLHIILLTNEIVSDGRFTSPKQCGVVGKHQSLVFAYMHHLRLRDDMSLCGLLMMVFE